MIDTLGSALKALEAGDTVVALEALLAAWREKRAPAVADTIDALGHAFPAPKFESPAQWMTLARGGQPADVFGLLASLVAGGPLSALGGRVEQLIELPDDPRIALAFAKLALDPPTTASSNFPVWSKMFACIQSTNDARVIPLLKKRAAMKPGTPSQFWPKLNGWIERTLKKLSPEPALTRDEAALVKKLLAAAKKAKPTKAAAPAPVRKAATRGDPLARAVAAVEANELPACVEALLDGWRARPLAAYARAIDRVTALHDERLACPGGDASTLEKAWRALAETRQAIDVGRLAASVGDGKPAHVDQRLEEMLSWPADPRIGRAMFTHFIGRTFSDRARTWGLIAELFVKNIDVRLASELEGFSDAGGENKAHRAAIRRAGPAALRALEKAATQPTTAELAAFERLDGALDAWDQRRPVSERRFLEALLAAPENDAAALVYADWLSETGHPRGELIMLQCAAEPDDGRIGELVGEHTRALLGVAACLPYSNLEYATSADWFRRGVLRKIELREPMPRWFFEGHPHLWFLEEIEPDDDLATAAAVIASSRSLRTLEVGPELLLHLAGSAQPLTVETLRFSHAREPEQPLAAVLGGLTGRGLSRVKHLELFWSNGELHQPGLPEVLVASPLFENLETLAVVTEHLDTVLAALKKHGRKVTTLSLLRRDYLACRLDVRLDQRLAPVAVSVGLEVDDEPCELEEDDDIEALVAALKSLALPRSLTLQVAKGVSLSRSARTALSKVVTL